MAYGMLITGFVLTEKGGEVEMYATEKVIIDLNEAKHILCHPQMLTPEMCIRIGKLITSAIALLKEQKNEYENGFNDAMLGKEKLMYEGTDGKWHRKDW